MTDNNSGGFFPPSNPSMGSNENSTSSIQADSRTHLLRSQRPWNSSSTQDSAIAGTAGTAPNGAAEPLPAFGERTTKSSHDKTNRRVKNYSSSHAGGKKLNWLRAAVSKKIAMLNSPFPERKYYSHAPEGDSNLHTSATPTCNDALCSNSPKQQYQRRQPQQQETLSQREEEEEEEEEHPPPVRSGRPTRRRLCSDAHISFESGKRHLINCELEEAQLCFESALRSRLSLLGGNHPEVAACHEMLGHISVLRGLEAEIENRENNVMEENHFPETVVFGEMYDGGGCDQVASDHYSATIRKLSQPKSKESLFLERQERMLEQYKRNPVYRHMNGIAEEKVEESELDGTEAHQDRTAWTMASC